MRGLKCPQFFKNVSSRSIKKQLRLFVFSYISFEIKFGPKFKKENYGSLLLKKMFKILFYQYLFILRINCRGWSGKIRFFYGWYGLVKRSFREKIFGQKFLFKNYIAFVLNWSTNIFVQNKFWG